MAEKGLLMLNQRYGIAPRINKEVIPGGSLFSNKNVYELIKNDNQDLLPKKYVLNKMGGLKLGSGLKDIKVYNKDQPDILRRLDFYLGGDEQKSLKDNTEVLSDTLQLNTEQKVNVEKEISKLEKEPVSKETKQEVQQNIKHIATHNTGKGKKLFGQGQIKKENVQSHEEVSSNDEEKKDESDDEIDESKNHKLQPVEINDYQKEAFNQILKGENLSDYEDKPVSKSGLVIISPTGEIKYSYRSFNEFKDSEQFKEYRKEMRGYKSTKKYGVPVVFTNGDAIFTLPTKVYNNIYPTNTMMRRNKKKYKKGTQSNEEGKSETNNDNDNDSDNDNDKKTE